MVKKRFLLNIFFCVFMTTTIGCDFVYRLLQKAGAEERDLVGEIIPAMTNERVREVQSLLKLFGYNSGRIDGKLGPKTREVLGKFQEDQGLEVTHFIDKATWARLNIFRDSGLVIDGEINIGAVQQALKQANFNPGKIDGKLGPRTIRAVKKFQKAHALKVDGKIGVRTLSKLAEYLSQTEKD